MRSIVGLALAGALALGGLVRDARADMDGTVETQAAPEGAYVVDISSGGSGCPHPAQVVTIPDRSRLVLWAYGMLLEHPPGPLFQSIACYVGITVQVPEGWQLSIRSVRTRPFAWLPEHVYAEVRSSYFLSGSPIGAKFVTRINGPHEWEADFTDDLTESNVWSACGGTAVFSVATNLILNTAGNHEMNAQVSLDGGEANWGRAIAWAWRRC